MFCFVGWVVYRTLKKPKQPGHEDGHKSPLSGLLPWPIPWRRRQATRNTRASNGPYEPNEALPPYDADNDNLKGAVGYYDPGKLYPLESEGMTYPPTATLQTERAMWQTPEGQTVLLANPPNQYQQPNGQTMDSSDASSTLQSRMLDPYYSPSKLARQPSNAYNPAQRQLYRASEVSSLSSGFGDGDIIMPPPNVMPRPPVSQMTSPDTNSRAFSWLSRAGTEQKRDTMYTTASDRPARFRSIYSWVDQQKDRIERAGSRAKIPPIPRGTSAT